MRKLQTYIITNTTPDELEVSTETAATFLNIKPQTLRKYRSTGLIAIPYIKNPGIQGRVRYIVKDLREYKSKLLVAP